MFIHLRAHSWYSFLNGLASPKELAQTAARLGMPALGLTDSGSLSGAIEFYCACQEVGVQPILGAELRVASPIQGKMSVSQPLELGLLAMNLAGWGNLCRLSSPTQATGNNPGNEGLPFRDLVAHSDGLLCLVGGRRGALLQALLEEQASTVEALLGKLKETFPQRLYIELQGHTQENSSRISELAVLAQRHHLPVTAVHPIYYLAPNDSTLQRLVTAIRLNTPLRRLTEAELPLEGAWFQPAENLRQIFSAHPQALEAPAEIASRCSLILPLGQARFPQLELPPGQTAGMVLRQKAFQGAQALYGDLTLDLQARMERELTTIDDFGYAPLFLVVEEIVRFAKHQGIPMSSRGSAASSLVAHCLGITSPDPVRLNLYFERFLNPARSSPPDIDTDLCSRRRDSVIQFVYDHFGLDRVAMVCTVNRFRRRSALREAAKAHGFSSSEIRSLTERLPHWGWGPEGQPSQAEAPFAGLEKDYQTPLHQALFSDATALIGRPRHLSIHPGGIVIAPVPLNDLVPTQWATKGVRITQFDLDSIGRLGLVKIDLLGIRGLTVLGDVAETQAYNASKQDAPNTFLERIPEEDRATAALIRSGKTIGCFQIESPGMRATLKEIQAGSIDDLMIALALYRPGPLVGGQKDAFVRRHLGYERTSQLHPALTPLLADTHGIILYQEQVLRVAHELGGLSLADADLLRRAMSHFDPGSQMRTLKEKFLAGAWQSHRVPQNTADQIWDLMAAFAGYGFPKAHAASYAQVAWRSAWCKVHYPAVFMAAVLANWGGFYSQRVYLMEARRLGLPLRAPEVNHAQPEFSVQYLDGKPVLFMGLNQVRDLTRRTQARILAGRPFHSLADFLARTDPRPIEAENLARVGALEEFGPIPILLAEITRGGWEAGQLSLFSMFAPPSEEDWSLAEKVAAQEMLLGAALAAHPLELVGDQVASAGAVSTIEAVTRYGQPVKVAGMRQTWTRGRTLRGEFVYFMALEDLEGVLDVLISASVYRQQRSELAGSGPYLLEGVMERDPTSGEPYLRAERAWRLEGKRD